MKYDSNKKRMYVSTTMPRGTLYILVGDSLDRESMRALCLERNNATAAQLFVPRYHPRDVGTSVLVSANGSVDGMSVRWLPTRETLRLPLADFQAERRYVIARVEAGVNRPVCGDARCELG